MQPAPGLADQIGQPLLDVEMDVLELGRELERAGRDRGLDLVKSAQDRGALGLGDDAGRGQHPGMRPRAREVVSRQPLVEPDRRINLRHQRCRVRLEMPAPQSAAALDLFRHSGVPMHRMLRVLAVLALLTTGAAPPPRCRSRPRHRSRCRP